MDSQLSVRIVQVRGRVLFAGLTPAYGRESLSRRYLGLLEELQQIRGSSGAIPRLNSQRRLLPKARDVVSLV